MDCRTFYQKVNDHRELDWLAAKKGDTPAEDFVIVGNPRFHTQFAFPLASIREHSWSDLEGVLTLKRPAKLMKHITRIVGYYSELSNWNPSKRAELDDRHKGNYGVPEAGEALPVPALIA